MEGALARITLRGTENAAWSALLDALRELPGTVRVVVFDGAWGPVDDRPAPAAVLERVQGGTVVSIADLSGEVHGSAAELALAATLRVARTDAVLVGGPGIGPPWSGLPLLRERLGTGRALAWLAGRHPLGPAELTASGLAEPGPADALVAALLALPDDELRLALAVLSGRGDPVEAAGLAGVGEDGGGDDVV